MQEQERACWQADSALASQPESGNPDQQRAAIMKVLGRKRTLSLRPHDTHTLLHLRLASFRLSCFATNTLHACRSHLTCTFHVSFVIDVELWRIRGGGVRGIENPFGQRGSRNPPNIFKMV